MSVCVRTGRPRLEPVERHLKLLPRQVLGLDLYPRRPLSVVFLWSSVVSVDFGGACREGEGTVEKGERGV